MMSDKHRLAAWTFIGIFYLIYFYFNDFFMSWGFGMYHSLGIIPIAIIFSDIADLDSRSSHFHRRTMNLIIIFLIGLSLFDIAYKSPYGYFMLGGSTGLWFMISLKHRGLLHSLRGSFILSAALVLIHPIYAIFGFIVSLGHLILDKNIRF